MIAPAHADALSSFLASRTRAILSDELWSTPAPPAPPSAPPAAPSAPSAPAVASRAARVAGGGRLASARVIMIVAALIAAVAAWQLLRPV